MFVQLPSDVSVGVGNGGISVTAGRSDYGPVAWVRSNVALSLAGAGVVAWALGARTVGFTLAAAGAAVWFLGVTTPQPPTTVAYSPEGGLTIQ